MLLGSIKGSPAAFFQRAFSKMVRAAFLKKWCVRLFFGAWDVVGGSTAVRVIEAVRAIRARYDY